MFEVDLLLFTVFCLPKGQAPWAERADGTEEITNQSHYLSAYPPPACEQMFSS